MHAHTAISIKVVPKKREKVEYERERLIGKTSFIPEYITIHRVITYTYLTAMYFCSISNHAMASTIRD